MWSPLAITGQDTLTLLLSLLCGVSYIVELVVVAGYIAITGQYTLTLLKGGALGTVDSLVSWKINIHDSLTFISIICLRRSTE